MKFLYSMLFVFIFIISGCSNLDKEIKKKLEIVEDKTIEQAILEASIPIAEIVYTEEIDDEEAFSLYRTSNGCGIMHFTKEDNGWDHGGRTSIEYSREDVPSLTIGQSTVPKGALSTLKENNYSTVFYGEIIDSEINKIIVEYDDKMVEANIAIGYENQKYWSLASEYDEGKERLHTVSAYSSEGKLIHKDEFNL